MAVENGQVVGCIMGKIETNHTTLTNRRYQLLLKWKNLVLSLRKESKEAMQFNQQITDLNKALLHETGQKFDGELVLFIVDKSARGKGIGTLLLEDLFAYFADQEIQNIYLFTDTSCNYRFYERHGFIKRGSKTLQSEMCEIPLEKTAFSINAASSAQLYIYIKKVNEWNKSSAHSRCSLLAKIFSSENLCQPAGRVSGF